LCPSTAATRSCRAGRPLRTSTATTAA
jgi:hypothetical protein